MRAWPMLVPLLVGLVGPALACAPPPEGMRWSEVVRKDLVIGVEVAGAIQAVDSDNVGPPALSGVWNYKISMMAPEGEVVEEGGPVLGFDQSDLQRRLEAKIAERDSAATQLALKLSAARVAREDERLALSEAEATLRKAKLAADAPAELVAVIELEKSRLDLELAEQRVRHLRSKANSAQRGDNAELQRWKRRRDRAEERVTEIRAAIEAMTVKAPRTGTVIYQSDWQGEKKKVGDGAWRSQVVMQVVSLEKMQAIGEVDEVDIAKVAATQRVTLRLDAQPDAELTGTVVEVRESVGRASAQSPLKVASLEIRLEDTAEAKLRPGMRFRGTIETERASDALVLPLEAIVPSAEGPRVRQPQGEGWVERPVELGRRNAFGVEVLDGLEEGDKVLSVSADDPEQGAR